MLPYISNIQIKLRVYYIGFIYRKYRLLCSFSYILYSPIFITSCSNVSGLRAIARSRTL